MSLQNAIKMLFILLTFWIIKIVSSSVSSPAFVSPVVVSVKSGRSKKASLANIESQFLINRRVAEDAWNSSISRREDRRFGFGSLNSASNDTLGETKEPPLPTASSPLAKILVSDRILSTELDMVCRWIGNLPWNDVLRGSQDSDTSFSTENGVTAAHNFAVECISMDEFTLPPGATGRVLLLQIGGPSTQPIPRMSQETIESWQLELSQKVDSLLYNPNGSSLFQQPILFSVEKCSANCETGDPLETNVNSNDRLSALILDHVQDYGLREALVNSHDHELKQFYDPLAPECCLPVLHYQVDGANIVEKNFNVMLADSSDPQQTWDTSAILVWDGLVSDSLRRRLLGTVLGQDLDGYEKTSIAPWDDIANGPDPTRWTQGGLTDLPIDSDARDMPVDDLSDAFSFGLDVEALEGICSIPPPDSFQEMESIFSSVLFPDFIVTRLPDAMFEDGVVTPITANAPCHGQSFGPHIDADPFSTPPSPWTDVFGRYPNRASGKPRFVSCLVYLNEEWQTAQWGAPTRFFDVATDTAVDVAAQPGRLVILDQDITHTVVPPLQAAGKRPRYSLVWKLVLHPKQHHQDMRRSMIRPGWTKTKTIAVGSAQQ